MNKFDPIKTWIHYSAEVDHHRLDKIYNDAELGIFASTCENLPIILIEKMASGLPIACSNAGVMPEIAKDCCTYFDSRSTTSIAEALERLITDPFMRKHLSDKSREAAKMYTWGHTADATFSFLANAHHINGLRRPKVISKATRHLTID
jgi:glycosyltransferase involved in cell wall biosynthesis